ncbi:MAG: ComEC/Rec2 family competence protein [Bacteroidetes bacterium]|nr:ComEC/Rec2 family competence protein [Bacteroidota bacterium]
MTSSDAHPANFLIEWKQFPFIRIAPGLICGILCGKFLLSDNSFLWIAGIAAFILMAIQFRKRLLLFHIGLHFLLMLSGILLVQNKNKTEVFQNRSYNGPAIVCQAPIKKAKTYKTTLLIDRLPPMNKRVKTVAYLKKSETASSIRPGDRLLVDMDLKVLESPELPGLFDYGKFLNDQHIFYTTYVRPENWELLEGSDFRMLVKRRTSYLRKKLAKHFERTIPEPTSALIKAMFLGEKSHIESDTRDSFAKAGIVHILAVSGLHVGIIYMVISLMLRPFLRLGRHWKVGIAMIEVATIWGFALMTGSGPSVQRAAFMFSLFSVAKLARMDTHAVNITAASAVLLIIIDPAMLFKAGFQLSYTAVFGILLTHPVFYPKLIIHNKLLDWTWQMQVVSFGAVAGTAPISIYLFHQFPLAFPLANLLAIPASFVLICGAIVLVVFKWLPGLTDVIGILLNYVGSALVNITQVLAGMRFSHISQIHISRSEALLIYLFMILSLCLVIRWQSRLCFRYATAVLLTFMLLQQSQSIIRFRHVTSRELYKAGDGFHYNVGHKQYQFQPMEAKDDLFKPDLSGHYKYDRIQASEVFYLTSEQLEEISDCLKSEFD